MRSPPGWREACTAAMLMPVKSEMFCKDQSQYVWICLMNFNYVYYYIMFASSALQCSLQLYGSHLFKSTAEDFCSGTQSMHTSACERIQIFVEWGRGNVLNTWEYVLLGRILSPYFSPLQCQLSSSQFWGSGMFGIFWNAAIIAHIFGNLSD